MPCCDNGDYKDEDFMRCAQCGRPLSSSDEPCDHKSSSSEEDSKPKSHLLLAILSTVFGCSPFGIIAVVYAVKAGSALKYGDLKAAKDCSDGAFFWASLAILPVILLIALLVLRSLG